MVSLYRVLATFGAAALFFAAQRLPVAAEPRSADLTRTPITTLLGPVRPLYAELLLLKLELETNRGKLLQQLDLASQVLAIRPDLPSLRAELGLHFALDLPAEEADSAAATIWVRCGLSILEDARRQFPEDPSIHLASAHVWVALRRHHLDRLGRLGVSEPEAARRVLDHLLVAYEHSAGNPIRGVVRLLYALTLQELLERPSENESLQALALLHAETLIADPSVPEETRRQLWTAIRQAERQPQSAAAPEDP